MDNTTGRKQSVVSPFEKIGATFLNSDMLRVVAIVLMVSDHVWATFMSFGDWMTYIGRMAFPIFAFQIAEGFVHTLNLKKYTIRLLVFALVSEIPFNYFYSSRALNPYHQNVMFTLLLGLLAITVIDKSRGCKEKRDRLKYIIALTFILLASVIGFADYGFWGVFMVVMFYIFRGFRLAWLCQLVGMIMINVVLFEGQMLLLDVPGRAIEIPVQSFAVLSLIPIWLYNGKKGKSGKAVQYGFYAFYPAHMLILYLIKRFS